MLRSFLIMIFVVAAGSAHASEWDRCDPRREDFWGSFGCEEVRQRKYEADLARLAQLRARYESLSLENASLRERLGAATDLKKFLQAQLSDIDARIAGLRRRAENADNVLELANAALSELRALDQTLTAIIETRLHCYTPEQVTQIDYARREVRNGIAVLDTVVDGFNLGMDVAKQFFYKNKVVRLLAQIHPYTRWGSWLLFGYQVYDEHLRPQDPICSDAV